MSLAGRLLVATPVIADPNFERTVVLILAHGSDGAFGVVLNRPGDLLVSEVAAPWAAAVGWPAVVFVGGPVGSDAVLGLGRAEEAIPGATVLPGGCTLVDLDEDSCDGRWSSVRLFAGSAGWAGGQLEDEVAEGAWWAVDAGADDLLTIDPEGLWAAVLRRQRGELAWFANYPMDPCAN